MPALSINQFSKEEIKEMSLVEIAYELLLQKKEAVSFNELVEEIAQIKELSKEEITARIAQFYTDLNVDGRFTAIGDNRWGLKTWYSVDQVEEEAVHTVKAKKKKKSKKALDDDFDEFDVEEDLVDLDELEEDLDDDSEDVLLDEEEDVLLDDVEEDLDDDLIEDEDFEIDEEEEDEEEEDFEEEDDVK